MFPVEDNLLQGHNMASSGLRKMLTLINFSTLGVWVLVCPAICMDTVVNGNHIVMADVVALALWWQMLLPLHYVGRCCALDLWHMLFTT